MTKVCTDTNIVSALVQQDISAEEAAALEKVLEIGQDKRRLELVTSNVTGEEIAKIPPEHRRLHQVIYRLLAHLPRAAEVTGGSNLLLLSVGGGG